MSALPPLLPASAILATRNRPEPLRKTLESLAGQSRLPAEIVIVDASADDATGKIIEGLRARWNKIGREMPRLAWRRHEGEPGAAPQRNAAVALARQPWLLFMDDDILLEPGCLAELWRAANSSEAVAGVSALIVNEKYHPPGRWSRMLFRWLDGGRDPESWAGRVIGPGLALPPGDELGTADFSKVEWASLCCVFYSRQALPNPPFHSFFHGASTGEDFFLSLQAKKRGSLLNAGKARIYHDSQPGAHKESLRRRIHMELVNRWFISTEALGRGRPKDFVQSVCAILFQSLGTLRQPGGWREFPARILGIAGGTFCLLRERLHPWRHEIPE